MSTVSHVKRCKYVYGIISHLIQRESLRKLLLGSDVISPLCGFELMIVLSGQYDQQLCNSCNQSQSRSWPVWHELKFDGQVIIVTEFCFGFLTISSHISVLSEGCYYSASAIWFSPIAQFQSKCRCVHKATFSCFTERNHQSDSKLHTRILELEVWLLAKCTQLLGASALPKHRGVLFSPPKMIKWRNKRSCIFRIILSSATILLQCQSQSPEEPLQT